MKERPILFSGPMVRAILEGKKTQTRRVVKPQPDQQHALALPPLPASCPYGKPGDRLWVRERISWEHAGGNWLGVTYAADGHYEEFLEPPVDWNTDDPPKTRPSIHMPRWASRLTLEITEVRVQRLQDISEEDAIAEGMPNFIGRTVNGIAVVRQSPTPREEFATLWDSINGKRPGCSWSDNPCVWAITFRRITP